METTELHRGRLIDHLQLVVKDIAASRKFYESLFKVLGIEMGGAGSDFFWCDELFVSTADSKAAQGALTGRHHFAFQAGSQKQVQDCHRAGLEAGGKDHGAPGLRPYHPAYYAAFLLDPDGNNVEVVFHGSAKRSAASVKIQF